MRNSDSVLASMLSTECLMFNELSGFHSREGHGLKLTIPHLCSLRISHDRVSVRLVHISQYSPDPGHEAGNLGEDGWWCSHAVSIGHNPLGHVVAHQGAPRVPLWVSKKRTLSQVSSCRFLLPPRPDFQRRLSAYWYPSLMWGYLCGRRVIGVQS